MNVQNINKLIKHLEIQTRYGFNMAAFVRQPPQGSLPDHSPNHCGTTACLAGHIWHITNGMDLNQPEAARLNHTVFMNGQQFLDLSREQAFHLFGVSSSDAEPPGINLLDVTLEQAIKCLKILRDTNKVNWKEALR